MTTKAVFKCPSCGFEKEFSICEICRGVIDVPHNPHPNCEQCKDKMNIITTTIRKL